MGNDNISLKYLVEITKGKKPKYEIDVYSEGLIPYLSMDYLRGKNLSPIYVDETKDSIVRVNNNDLLILWDGSKAGEIVYGKEGALSSTMAKIDIVSSKVTKAYLTYFLIHSQADIQGNTVGMGIPHVNGEDLKNLSVYLSSKQTQIRIAEFLDKKTEEINAIIEKKEAILLRLEEKKKAIINEAVTKGLNPNVPMKDSGIEWIGEIPAHWEISKLKYFVNIKGRLGWKGLKADEYVDSGYGFLSTPDIKNDDIDFSRINYITEERYLESPEIMLEKDDILLVKDGSTLGIINRVKELPIPSTVNSSIAVLRIEDPSLKSEFLFYLLKSNWIQKTIEFLKQGQGVPHLFQKDIKEFDLIIPPIKEQEDLVKEIFSRTKIVDDLNLKILSQIEKLKEYRQAIISEAVTGKLEIA
jgi:type I restriction enzyme S subunit